MIAALVAKSGHEHRIEAHHQDGALVAVAVKQGDERPDVPQGDAVLQFDVYIGVRELRQELVEGHQQAIFAFGDRFSGFVNNTELDAPRHASLPWHLTSRKALPH